MYRIRFHGRGGQGMKTASRILGTAFFLEGFEVQDAPRYGAERRGAPLFAYVRADRKTINERGVIQHPDLVVVADDTLVMLPAAGVLVGISARSMLLIHGYESADTWQKRLNFPGRVLILTPTEDLEDRAELRYIGASCAGAAACLVGLQRVSLEQAIREELSVSGNAVLQHDLEKALEAYEAMTDHIGSVREGETVSAAAYQRPDWVELPYEDVELSAPDIHGAATSVQVKTGLWRTMRPVIDYHLCHHCWACNALCPEGAIAITDDTPYIDYDHCKGCLICVVQCPYHAMLALPEHRFAIESSS
jgi:pyruvate ferredoxin oxidoreductase gamma subunit